jgi:hypothetical protein
LALALAALPSAHEAEPPGADLHIPCLCARERRAPKRPLIFEADGGARFACCGTFDLVTTAFGFRNRPITGGPRELYGCSPRRLAGHPELTEPRARFRHLSFYFTACSRDWRLVSGNAGL